MGRHARPSKTAIATGAATTGALLAGAAVAAVPAHAAVQVPEVPTSPPVTSAVVTLPPPPAVKHYKVRPGDTLSAIAQRFCGSAAKWPALWHASKARIKNPNLIYPGQLVTLACKAILGKAAPPEQGGPLDAPPPTPSVTVTGSQGVIGGGALRAIQHLVKERIDEGQDFSGTGPLYAVAPGTITSIYGAGWPGGVYILEKLDNPIDGFGYVYYAEDIIPAVRIGDRVDGSTVLGTVYHGGTGIELGWGTAVPQVAAAAGHYADGVPTPEGESFARFLWGPPPPKPHKHHASPSALPHLAAELSRQGYDGPALAATAVYLHDHGYTAAAAAGVDGCIAGESGGNPESEGMGGGGLIGWTPLSSASPVQPVITGHPARDLRAQLTDLIAYDNANGGVPQLNAEPGPAAAARLYSSRFERPAVPYSDVRYAVAQEVYTALGG